ncbi:putative Protein kinase domain containing protein [Blattamonas nauphoetae]|uniref:Protein kinase domain-containing protein n=1 Tax=Blattamonas nauphoetae TaxID=2049346 RepID=A0ABQ9YJW3_9EUKA|nr:putative Protein kinase domain containing protein [Blattamonas nauphoetae]
MTNSDVSGKDESTEFLFHFQNSTISFDNLNFVVSGESRIANLLDSSHVQISCAILIFESSNTPITTDLGTVALLNITLRGYSLLPEILESSSPDSHLLVSQCLCDDVIVGSSPLFGCSTYSAEITQSSFSNIDHIVPNQYYYPTKTLCATDPSNFPYTTDFAESTMRNVTDDIYGSITDAPISGNSFMLRDLQSIQQTVKTDVLLSNKKANETVMCAITKKYTVQNYKFVDGSDPYSTGYLGLVIIIYAPAITLTVSGCSFEGLSSQGSAGLFIESSTLSSSDPTDAPKVSIKSCKFVNLNGWSFLSIYPLDNNCTISKCSMISCTASGYCVAIFPSVSSIQNIELRISGCGFQLCRSNHQNSPGFDIIYPGTVVFDKQSVFEEMSFGNTGLRVQAPSIKFTQTSVLNCNTTTNGSPVELYADTILVEDVHLKKNRGTCSPSQLFIALTQNYWSSEGQYATLNRIYVEKLTSYLFEILVVVPDNLLTSGHLNKQWVTELNTDSNRNIIASTSYELEISPSYQCGMYDGLLTDETSSLSQIGEDPRKYKSTWGIFDTSEGTNKVIVALTTSLPATLIIIVGIVADIQGNYGYGRSCASTGWIASHHETVVEMRENVTKEHYAGKIIRCETQEERKRIEREVRRLRSFNEPTIVKLKEVISMDKTKVIVMELGGRSLAGICDPEKGRKNLLPRDTVYRIITDIASALNVMHNQSGHQVVHGNIKLDNILVNSDGHAKLLVSSPDARVTISHLIRHRLFRCLIRTTQSLWALKDADDTLTNHYALGIMDSNSGVPAFRDRLATFVSQKALLNTIAAAEGTPTPIPAVYVRFIPDNIRVKPRPAFLDKMCKENGFLGWTHVALGSDISIDKTFSMIGRAIL